MKIFCVGRNYRDHATELGNAVPAEPVIFLKPDTALLKGADFYLPEFSQDIHHEIELVVRFCKGGKYIAAEKADQYYEEMTVGLDFTARDVQAALKANGLPWELAKGFDGSAVLGKFRSKNQFLDTALQISLQKNGQVVQSGTTDEMLFSIPELVAYISKYFTIRPGDVLFTGTPAGVGQVQMDDRLEGFLNNEKLFDIRIQ